MYDGGSKKILQILLLQRPTSLKFQTLLTYTTEGSNVHGRVIRGACAEEALLQQCNMVAHLENWSRLEVQGFICLMRACKMPLYSYRWCDSSPWQCPTAGRHSWLGKWCEIFGWETLYYPPYSPELALSDFHMFPALKEHLSEYRFTRDENVKRTINVRLTQQANMFDASGSNKLITRCDKCLRLQDDCVEKYRISDTFIVYCDFSQLKSFLWFMGNVNLLSDQLSRPKVLFLHQIVNDSTLYITHTVHNH
jgi:hypothetical protein